MKDPFEEIRPAFTVLIIAVLIVIILF